MKDIYLVMTHSGTIVSKIIKLYTRTRYSHISIGFDKNLESFYSFGRKRPHSPIGGGFVQEGIGKGVFSICKKATCRVYKLSLTDDQYEKLDKTLKLFIENKDYFKYNYLGIITIMFGIPYRRQNYYFCSQFVAEILQNNKIVQFDKDFTLVRPRDFYSLENAQMIYEGKLAEYRNTQLQ